MEKIDIQTRDGRCPAYVYRPVVGHPWPAVLVYMDGYGIRHALLEIGARLSTYGYFVLIPDLFYRSGPYEPMNPLALSADPDKRKALMDRHKVLATPANVMSDTQAFLEYLDRAPDVRPGKIGATGYCMGGSLSLTAAGTFPERFAATASYHGGRLATDAPDSPHLLAPKIKSRVYVAGATDDASFPDDMKARLAAALRAAGVNFQIETYPAWHGWVFRDNPAYDHQAAERHWHSLIALLDATLRND